MRRALLLSIALLACGDPAQTETAELCVLSDAGAARAWAGYYLGDAGPQVVDDVPVERGRACLELSPPSDVPAPVDEVRLSPLVEAGTVPIEIVVYEDANGSGAPDPGERHLQRAQSGGPHVHWVRRFDYVLTVAAAYGEAARVTALVAPGNRPFVTTSADDEAQPWGPITLPAFETGRQVCYEYVFPRCRTATIANGRVVRRLVDPRVPADDLRFEPIHDFVSEAPVVAPACALHLDYLVALAVQTTAGPLADTPCGCTLTYVSTYVVARADDPPAWLECTGYLSEEWAVRDLVEAAGVVFDRPPPEME